MKKTHRIRHSGDLLSAAITAVVPKGIDVDDEGTPVADVSRPVENRLRLHVARSAFGINFRDGRAYEKWLEKMERVDRLDPVNLMNEAMLPLYGVGADCFYFNEFLDDNEMRSMTTLLAYDTKAHEEQVRLRSEDGVVADGTYRPRMHWDWARWLEGGKLVYGNLSAAANVLASSIDDKVGDVLHDMFPTEMNFERIENGWSQMVITPSDRAEKKSLLMRACYEEVHSRRPRWHKELEAMAPGVIVDRSDEGGELNAEIVFLNSASLGEVNVRNFLADVARLRDARSDYEAFAKRETADYADWLSDEHGISLP